MDQKRTHSLVIEKVYPSGAEEWCCKECGRRLILQWRPEYRRIILVPGEENVLHTGNNAGVQVQPDFFPPEHIQSAALAHDSSRKDRLDPWREWMNDHPLEL